MQSTKQIETVIITLLKLRIMQDAHVTTDATPNILTVSSDELTVKKHQMHNQLLVAYSLKFKLK